MNCESCLKKFNGLTILPQLMQPCNHTICLDCLSSLDNTSCPICYQLITSSSLNQEIIDEINNQVRLNQSVDRSASNSSSFESISSFSSFDLNPLDNSLNEKLIRNIDERFRTNDKNSPAPLFKPGRVFALESVFIKECKKKPKQRIFFLFNDLLVYGKKTIINSNKLVSQHVLSLADMQVKPFNTTDSNHSNGIFIMTPKKSFTVYANTPREKTEWLTRLQQFISLEKVENLITRQESIELAPLWTPDKKATNCMRCSEKFSLLNRRHHCRVCGQVVCNECSIFRLFLPHICDDEPVRVCKKCHENHLEKVKLKRSIRANPSNDSYADVIIKRSLAV